MTEKKKALKLPEAGGWQDKAAPWLALAGGVILLAAAGVMWLSAVPAGGGIRPF